ncbi:MAG: rRNA maturation RNase YbeY [Elusimicrobia bacterium]|nr:rRNA maturation RNase YbeY [Elusimicrobiota bacterium]
MKRTASNSPIALLNTLPDRFFAADLPSKQLVFLVTQKIKRLDGFSKIRTKKILVVFCDDPHIRRVKRLFWGKAVTTDVVSLSYDDPPLVEILINVQQARRQAPSWGVLNEVLFLYIHGLLHVMGYDDDTLPKRRKMLNLGRSILEKVVDIGR